MRPSLVNETNGSSTRVSLPMAAPADFSPERCACPSPNSLPGSQAQPKDHIPATAPHHKESKTSSNIEETTAPGGRSRRSHSPIKDEAHELQVEGAGKAEEADPPGGILLALAGLTEVAVVSFELLFLARRKK